MNGIRHRITWTVILLISAILTSIILIYPVKYWTDGRHNTYIINIHLNDSDKILDCSQQLKYTNREKEVLNELYFHLYPNAFKKEETVPVLKDELSIAYPKGFSEGYIEIQEVKVSGRNSKYETEGETETLLRVDMQKGIKPGETAEVFIRFKVKLPHCIGRFGYGENSINIANWYPILCVYDEKGWNKDPYYLIGDPFYSEVSDYEVSITMPDRYKVAHTGQLMDTRYEDGFCTYIVRADKVRDFALFASENYEQIENRVADTTIKSCSFSGGGEKALIFATKALLTFNELFGKYPYEVLTIAESDFYVGGMEYPQIVQIDSTAYKDDELWLEYLIAHEVAHQWWYGLVGNDEINEPWLDEGLTEYSTLLYFEYNYGAERKKEIMQSYIIRNIELYEEYANTDDIIYNSLYEFDDWRKYSVVIYSNGAMVHEKLRNAIGDKKYFTLLRKYFEKYKYKNARIADFINLAVRIAGKNAANILNNY